MGDKRDIMLITSERLSGDYPRKSRKFKSLFKSNQDGVGVRKDPSDTNFWVTYRYAVGFALVVGLVNYFLIEYLFVHFLT